MELPRALSPDEQSAIDRFESATKEHANSLGRIDPRQWNLAYISSNLRFDITKYAKEGVVIQAMWVVILKIYGDNLRNVSQIPLKYVSIEGFLRSYDNIFYGVTELELQNLWQTANWMAILLQLVSPKKNKGLAIAVVPKVVEGWWAKYITGSGQSRSTADRVKIFETEGNIKASQRNCLSRVKNKNFGDAESYTNDEPVKKRGKGRHELHCACSSRSSSLPLSDFNTADALRAMAYYDRLKGSGIFQSSESIEDLITGQRSVESLFEASNRIAAGNSLSYPRVLRSRSIETNPSMLTRNRSIESVDGDFLEMLEILRSVSRGSSQLLHRGSSQVLRRGSSQVLCEEILSHAAGNHSLEGYDQDFIDMVSLLRSVSGRPISCQVVAPSRESTASTSVASGGRPTPSSLSFILVDESGENPTSLTLK